MVMIMLVLVVMVMVMMIMVLQTLNIPWPWFDNGFPPRTERFPQRGGCRLSPQLPSNENCILGRFCQNCPIFTQRHFYHISEAGEANLQSITSGLMYSRVPHMVILTCPSSESSKFSDNPKSMILRL